MKGVLLAGGTGSRLSPLTDVINKHLLPVGDIPMIYHSIEQFKNCDIKDVMIITGLEHAGTVIQQLGSGAKWDMNFTYRVQDEAGGIAQALLLAKSFAKDSSIMVLLGDNIFGENLSEISSDFVSNREAYAQLVLKEVSDPERFGVAEVKAGKIIGIEEKPEIPKTNLAIVGCYFYKYPVWDAISQIKPSARGEYEISDVNLYLLETGKLVYKTLTSWWTDAGTPDSYSRAQVLVKGSQSG